MILLVKSIFSGWVTSWSASVSLFLNHLWSYVSNLLCHLFIYFLTMVMVFSFQLKPLPRTTPRDVCVSILSTSTPLVTTNSGTVMFLLKSIPGSSGYTTKQSYQSHLCQLFVLSIPCHQHIGSNNNTFPHRRPLQRFFDFPLGVLEPWYWQFQTLIIIYSHMLCIKFVKITYLFLLQSSPYPDTCSFLLQSATDCQCWHFQAELHPYAYAPGHCLTEISLLRSWDIKLHINIISTRSVLRSVFPGIYLKQTAHCMELFWAWLHLVVCSRTIKYKWKMANY